MLPSHAALFTTPGGGCEIGGLEAGIPGQPITLVSASIVKEPQCGGLIDQPLALNRNEWTRLDFPSLGSLDTGAIQS